MAKKNKTPKDKTKAKQKERYSGPVFTTEFPLVTEPWQEDVIDHSMEAGRNMDNALRGRMLRRYNEMIKTKEYRTLMESITGDKKKIKILGLRSTPFVIEMVLTNTLSKVKLNQCNIILKMPLILPLDKKLLLRLGKRLGS